MVLGGERVVVSYLARGKVGGVFDYFLLNFVLFPFEEREGRKEMRVGIGMGWDEMR